MSIICQYDQLKNACYMEDLARKVVVEAKLKLPDEMKVGVIVGGDFLVDTTAVSVNDDLLIVSGRICPRLIYMEEHQKRHERYRKRNEYSDAAGNTEEYNENEEVIDLHERVPLEYGVCWPGEDGVTFEERIEISGLRKEMTVQVEVRPGACSFEKLGSDKVGFWGELNLTIHITYNHTAEIMNDVIVQGPERITTNKERVTVEEVIGIKRAVLPVRTSLMLPGMKPGMVRILSHQVRPSGISWEVNRGRVLLKGYLDIGIIYIGCDDMGNPTEIFSSDWGRDSGTAVPFEAFLENGLSDEEVIIVPKVLPRNITMEISGHRELHCKMDLECAAKVSRVAMKEMVVSVNPDAKEIIDTQKYLLNFEEYAGESTGDISLDVTIDLPSGMEGLERVLNYRGVCGDFKAEASGNNVIVEGSLDLWLAYVTGDSNMRIASWERANDCALPVAGMVEMTNLQPGALFNTQLILESLRLEPINDRSLRVTGTVKVRVFARNPRAVFVLKDCALVVPVDPATRPSMMFYIVQPDDSLWKIARRYQTTVDTLAKANQVANPDNIQVGQKLLIPKLVG